MLKFIPMCIDLHGHGCVKWAEAISVGNKPILSAASLPLHSLLQKMTSITNFLLESGFKKAFSESLKGSWSLLVDLKDPSGNFETLQTQFDVQVESDIQKLEWAILDGNTPKALELIKQLSSEDLISKGSDAPLESADYLGHKEIFLAIFEKISLSENGIDYAKKFLSRSIEGKGLVEIFFERNIEVAKVLVKNLDQRDLYLLTNQAMQNRKDEAFVDFLIDFLPEELAEASAKTFSLKFKDSYLDQVD